MTSKSIGNALNIIFINLFHHTNFSIHSQITHPFKAEIDKRTGSLFVGTHFCCRQNCQLIVKGELNIGQQVFLNSNVSITCLAKITIGDRTSIGNNVVIVDHDHDFFKIGSFTTKEVKIGNDVWIGANCVILKGVTIGDNSVIGAGCIVSHNVPKNTIFLQTKNENFHTRK